MFKAGTVVIIEDFKFMNGTAKDKYFVVLHHFQAGSPCFTLITTSKSTKYSEIVVGCCQIEKYYSVGRINEPVFSKFTFIKLDQPFPFDFDYLENLYLNNRLRILGEMSNNSLRGLKN